MRKHLLVAGIAAAALIPSFALAQQTCEQQRQNRVAGTVVGAGLGAIAGSMIAGRHDRTTGAVVGGLGGAVVGNQLSKPNADCTHAYGFYDANGAWHANAVDRAAAAGYYDREGVWIDGAPNGYYDGEGRWIAAQTSASTSGYFDAQNHWVPVSAQGYYNDRGEWIVGANSGHYEHGRWIAGPSIGRYDTDGRWIEGQASGHRDGRGVWIADAQPGYYDTSGRWVAGPATGYYDTQGRWFETADRVQRYRTDSSYQTRGGPAVDMRTREAWLEQKIQAGIQEGSLTRREGMRADRTLNQIRRDEANMRRRDGQLSQRNETRIQARLDALSESVRAQRQD
jgi:type II secretory pathway pseudopilin PulG